ncbi:hypothetical protein chiPu_0012661 [Chiloscyllium punctatum]|uniref:Uncharacterized protein n=1 Tax=Chiloscyllium punctatum TaxID=137246 RepID=A0A401SUX5_CHIPU|nr:hypothetical protein [Chiloscyllium punctatum]
MLAKLEVVHAQKDAKCSFPLGPYPRYTWIHEDTPEDGLDKTCYEIWKRVQQLSAQLDANQKEMKEHEPGQTEVDPETEGGDENAKGTPDEKVSDSSGKDDVSLLVHLEYLSIMGENANVGLQQPKPYEKCQATSAVDHSVRRDKELQCSGVELMDKDNFLNNILQTVSGTEQLPKRGSPVKEEVAEPRPTQCGPKDVLQLEVSTGGSVASNKEICQLLAQFSLKHINEAEAPDNKVVMEEAQIIKDFLQNNMFSSAGDKKGEASPPPLSSGESQDEQARRQLPVFAKLCEELVPSSKVESRQSVALERHNDLPLRAGGCTTPSDTRIQELPEAGSDLVKLLCTGQREAYPKEPGGQESPDTSSPEPREKAPGATYVKSEHSYSTSRHALKGTVLSARMVNAKESGKARDVSAAKLREEFGLAKCGEAGKESAHKTVAFTHHEECTKAGKRDGPGPEKADDQDGEPVPPARAILDASGSEGAAGSGNEDPICGQGLQPPPGLKEVEARGLGCGLLPEAESAGMEPGAYPDKSVASTGGGTNAQLPQLGAPYDCGGGKYIYPGRFPGGTLPLPSRPPLINYPPVAPGPTAGPPSTPGYAQHQPFYQPRAMRVTHQQPAAYQQASCFVRPTNPYNYSQMAQEYVPRQAYIRATYAPLVGYWSFVPEYSYTARNPPKPLTPVGGGPGPGGGPGGNNSNNNPPPPMAGDGPQCLFQPAYGYLESNIAATRFSSGRTGPVYNNSFPMYYPADGSGYNYW